MATAEHSSGTPVSAAVGRIQLNACGLFEFCLMPSRLKFKAGSFPELPVLRGFVLGGEFRALMRLRPQCKLEYKRVRGLLLLCWASAILALVGVVTVLTIRVEFTELAGAHPELFSMALVLSLMLVGAMQLLSHDLYHAIKRVVEKYNG